VLALGLAALRGAVGALLLLDDGPIGLPLAAGLVRDSVSGHGSQLGFDHLDKSVMVMTPNCWCRDLSRKCRVQRCGKQRRGYQQFLWHWPALTPNFRAARLQRPKVLNAKTFIPFHTPVLGWGDMAGPKLTDTINSYLVGVVTWAGSADLRDHAV
jgi:hypothetical protein